MPGVNVRLDAPGMAQLSRRIAGLLHDLTDMQEVWDEAAQYMKRSTVNRILRTKTSPDGERWAALSEVTIELKGSDEPLFEHGGLYKSIDVDDVSKEGFTISANAPYASWMQDGVARTRGFIKSSIPARPFMGFSEENIRRISKMIRDHLARGGD